MKRGGIAVFVNTFLRDQYMYRCLETCFKYVPDCRLYITDNGRMNEEKQRFYKSLEEQGHIIHIPNKFNLWWRTSFNRKVHMLNGEKYILKIDDDFLLTKKTNVQIMLDFLEKDPNLGLLGGRVWHTHRNEAAPFMLEIMEKNEQGYYPTRYADHSSTGYVYCDVVPDFWLARASIFNDIQMREDLGPGEGGHEVFFREIYEKRKEGLIEWRVGYTNESEITHSKKADEVSEEYKKYRIGSFSREVYLNNSRLILPGRKWERIWKKVEEKNKGRKKNV